jgi:peroxiredoxin
MGKSRGGTFFATALALLVAAGAAQAAVSVGSRAPGFTLPEAGSGSMVSLSRELSGHRATAVIFIATRCPYSNAYNTRMERIARDYAPRGMAVVGINSNVTEPPEEVARHAKEHGLTFPVLKDADSRIADLYGATRTPEVFLVDRAGAVVYHGRIDENYEHPDRVKSPDLRHALDALLSGRPIPDPETKAFGCTIKRP